MPRVHWSTLSERKPAYLVIFDLSNSPGVPNGGNDKASLRDLSNLLIRACTGLGFEGTYALATSRASGRPGIHVAFEAREDRDRLMRAAGAMASLSGSECRLTLDRPTHDALVLVGGPPAFKKRRAGVSAASLEFDQGATARPRRGTRAKN